MVLVLHYKVCIKPCLLLVPACMLLSPQSSKMQLMPHKSMEERFVEQADEAFGSLR